MFFEKTKLFNAALGCFKGLFSTDIGIDLGTCNTLISVQGKGIVLNEPSVVTISKRTGNISANGQAVGHVAHQMLGKTPGSLTAIRPLQNGVVGDFRATEAMLECFMRKVCGMYRKPWARPRVVIAVPGGITEVERRAVVETAQRAGARKVILVEEPMAAGIGSGLPIAEPTASMIIDIGGGTTEIAVMSLGDIASSQSLRVGGNTLDEAIIDHLKRTYNLIIGHASAERTKITIGSAAPLDEELTMEVAGRDAVTGMPRKVVLTSQEIRHALREPVGAIANAVVQTLERTPPELAADLIDNGIHICGGGSLLRGMDNVLANTTGLTVKRVEDPLCSVAKGTSVYIENLDTWKNAIDNSD